MSHKNRVNPDHYKVAGRGAQGEALVHDRLRQQYGERARQARTPEAPPARDRPRSSKAPRRRGTSGR